MDNKQSATILSILVFSIAIILSSSVFAVKPIGEDKVTQAELEEAINAEDAAMQLYIKNAIEPLQEQITKQQSALDKAIKDIADLQAVHPMIGESRGGGIVFYVDETERKGLIASFFDQSTGIQWANGEDLVTNANYDGVGAGAANTQNIMSTKGPGAYAAQVANDYRVQDDGLTECTGAVSEICRDDWYLPSKTELSILWMKKKAVGGFTDGNYWSSNETEGWSGHYANAKDFDLLGDWYMLSAKGRLYRVRPVRLFTY